MSGPRGLRRFVPPAGSPATPDPDATPAAGHPAEQAGADVAAAVPAARVPVPDASPAAGPAGDGSEQCEMCAVDVPAEHGHVADLETSSLVCACRACYLLFTQPTAGRGRYRSVPDRYVHDPVAPLTLAGWAELEIPVGLAFFLISGARSGGTRAGDTWAGDTWGSDTRDRDAGGQVTGFYPSPAGATECDLNLAAWQRLADEHPLLRAAEPDVEAVLIRQSPGGVESFVVPIDACYELAGRMRLQWRGFDGGAEARASIEEFLDRVRSRARPLATGLTGRSSA
jgi:Family of unknown function (DUF5947)